MRIRLSLPQGNILISVGKIGDEPIFGNTTNAIIIYFLNQDIAISSIKGFTEIQKCTSRKFLAVNCMLNQVNDAYDSMIRGVFPHGSKTSYNKLLFYSPKIINFFYALTFLTACGIDRE